MKRDYRICESMDTMETMGASAVTTEDLLAILLGNTDKAHKLLHQEETLFSASQEGLEGLKCLAGADFDSIKFLGGLTKTETAKILASMELGKRIANASATNREHITSPSDIAQYMMSRLRYEKNEKFYAIFLNTKNRIIRVKQISVGSLTSSVVHPRSVFNAAITSNSCSFIVAHNHPSGDPYPSTEDRNLTRALEEGGNVLGIPLIDHVVIGDGRYYSFKEHGDI